MIVGVQNAECDQPAHDDGGNHDKFVEVDGRVEEQKKDLDEGS
jgi:hypothetical protein